MLGPEHGHGLREQVTEVGLISRVLAVDTARQRVVNVTDDVSRFVAEVGGDGLCNLFLAHATAGLAVIETGSGSEADLTETLERLLPRDNRYRHSHGAPGHGADHVLPALISPSLTVPVHDGRLQLGVWQQLVVVDLNQDNPLRTLRVSMLTG